jgi:hypothetical protein
VLTFYPQELKVSRAADALMDIIAVVPSSARGNGMLLGSGDVLAALRGVLFEVGGPQSAFLWRMDMRMEQLGIFPQAWSYRMLPSHIVEDVTGDEDAGDQDTGHAEWETGSTTQLLC